MGEPGLPPGERKRPRLGLHLLRGLLLVALLVGCWKIPVYLYDRHALNRYLADLDERDALWRLEAIEQNRAEVPEEHNSARIVAAVAERLPADWPPDWLDSQVWSAGPGYLLDEAMAARVQGELARCSQALEQARTLSPLSSGRYRTQVPENPYPFQPSELERAGRVTVLLLWDARLRGHQNDLAGALVSCEAGLNAIRSLGDEPLFESQFVRAQILAVLATTLERILGMGEANDADLARLQHLLAEEEKQPIALWAWRSERARMHEVYQSIAAGRLTAKEVCQQLLIDQSWWEPYAGWLWWSSLPGEHLEMMKAVDEAVAIAHRPEHEQRDQEIRLFNRLQRRRWRTRLNGQPVLRHLFFPPKIFRDSLVALRASQVLLALERHHRQQRAWPADLAQLVPDFLPALPLDPSDGNPLRYRVADDAVTIYALGTDGIDHGGSLSGSHFSRNGYDYGYRLVDPRLRRKPAPVQR
jgi:hypothetical protein